MIVIIVGEMGSGKSTLLKPRFLKKSKKQKLCYALMQKDLGNYPYESNFVEYVNKAVRMKDSMFVIDEAKTCIPRKEPDASKKDFDRKLITWMLNSRKCNNAIFVVFHGLREIPLWLLMYTNYFIRFGTKDQINFQKLRFNSFQPIVDSLEDNPNIPKYQYDEICIRK